MRNCTVKVEGDALKVTVDLSKDCGRSKSGKSLIIASTDGAEKIAYKGKVICLGLNVYAVDRGGPVL
jgi:hypothetical protein